MVEEGEGDDEYVDSLLDLVPVLAGPRSVVDLPGGLTNRNLRVTTSAGDYVVRLSQSDAGLLGIDRDAEHANSRAAAEAGVGAHVVDYRPDLGMLVITFLPGVALTNETIGMPGVISRAATAIRRLQAGPRFVNDFDMFARQAGYLALVRENGFPLPDAYDGFASPWERVRRALAVRPAPTVPCNNDLLAGNFIDDGRRVWLIDYEYSGNNDPAFELGNTATECDLTRERTDELVASWAGGVPEPAFRARVDLQSLCSEYGWALWGFIQAATSPIDYDFHRWGSERFEKAARRFTSDGFDALLDEVALGG
jgi:thiamine kinase-like enzyme